MDMCKYHGPTCDWPERCLVRHPRKYDYDGAEEMIDARRLQVGHVLRMIERVGRSAYSDATIIRIYVKPWKNTWDKSYDTLAQAMAAATKDDYVWVKLARPYLYADTIGCVANWLVGVGTYEVEGPRLIDTHKVVVQSTGEYAKWGEAK